MEKRKENENGIRSKKDMKEKGSKKDMKEKGNKGDNDKGKRIRKLGSDKSKFHDCPDIE